MNTSEENPFKNFTAEQMTLMTAYGLALQVEFSIHRRYRHNSDLNRHIHCLVVMLEALAAAKGINTEQIEDENMRAAWRPISLATIARAELMGWTWAAFLKIKNATN